MTLTSPNPPEDVYRSPFLQFRLQEITYRHQPIAIKPLVAHPWMRTTLQHVIKRRSKAGERCELGPITGDLDCSNSFVLDLLQSNSFVVNMQISTGTQKEIRFILNTYNAKTDFPTSRLLSIKPHNCVKQIPPSLLTPGPCLSDVARNSYCDSPSGKLAQHLPKLV